MRSLLFWPAAMLAVTALGYRIATTDGMRYPVTTAVTVSALIIAALLLFARERIEDRIASDERRIMRDLARNMEGER